MCTGLELALVVGAFASTASSVAQSVSAGNQSKFQQSLLENNKPKIEPLKANKKQADSSIADTLKNRQTTGSKVAKSPTLLTGGAAGGIQDSSLNLSKSLIGG